MLLPEIGQDGQARLADSSALIVGIGGLGSVAALYLAAAGVGRLGLLDADVVALSNLHRQIIHTTPRIGMPKVESARQALQALNPACRVEVWCERLDVANAIARVRDYDVIVDGSDNVATRYALCDASVATGKPHVYGGVQQWRGHASVFAGRAGPCYRCLYPEPPPPDLAQNCAQAGVIGVVPGVIGLVQASETLKLLLREGEGLCGRLLRFDALTAKFSELQLVQDPACRCATKT